MRRRELENEISELRSAKHWAEERFAVLERENANLGEQLRDTDILMSALSAMQEKNTHLENSLSAETRIKLDLFSALGEAKRQLEIRESEYHSIVSLLLRALIQNCVTVTFKSLNFMAKVSNYQLKQHQSVKLQDKTILNVKFYDKLSSRCQFKW